jgi:RNA-directed DNA polymerase
MRLETPKKIQELQRALWWKAKREPTFRFYSLYDKVYRMDILQHAYAQAKANAGAPGVDGKTFEDIETEGLQQYLVALQEELRKERYEPEAVRRVMIPKPNGGERPLGIPTIKDRVVQTAVKIVVEPIFEADLTDNAYGYRPKRSAVQAVEKVHQTLQAGYTQVVDADLSKYFDTIPHAELLRSVARRISDRKILRIIKQWLKVAVEERGEGGKTTRRGSGSRGTPQGGVISPLLANIYMRRFLKAWEERGYHQTLRTQIVNYADDFVILSRGRAEEALDKARGILRRLGLTVNEEKTRVCNAWQTSFDFLGYTFGEQHRFGGKRHLGARPSEKSLNRLKDAIREATERHSLLRSVEDRVQYLNYVLRGWSNYFKYGTLWKTYNKVDRYVQGRIRCWLVRKHKRKTRGNEWCSPAYLYQALGLLELTSVMRERKRERKPFTGA